MTDDSDLLKPIVEAIKKDYLDPDYPRDLLVQEVGELREKLGESRDRLEEFHDRFGESREKLEDAQSKLALYDGVSLVAQAAGISPGKAQMDIIVAMKALLEHVYAQCDEAREQAESYRDSVVSHLSHPDIFLQMVEKRGPDSDAHKRCALPWEKSD